MRLAKRAGFAWDESVLGCARRKVPLAIRTMGCASGDRIVAEELGLRVGAWFRLHT